MFTILLFMVKKSKNINIYQLMNESIKYFIFTVE